MTRTALIALSVIAVLLAGIAHVNASGKQASDATIAELEARIEALEAIAIVPQEENFGPAGELLLSGVPVYEIIPSDPTRSVDFICTINQTIEGYTGTYRDDMSNLHCVRYLRTTPGG
ncbi:MAG: hypothetical protein M3464_04205 [Chloroflexota bacterium]|nr:hypothetical protein [Chloroflexota bacterium]